MISFIYAIAMLIAQFTIPFHSANASNPAPGVYPWSALLDPSRATNWATAGFPIPTYTVPCTTQPTLLTGSTNNAVNTTRINTAIASCNGTTQNVVNITQSGTFYVAGINFGGKSNVVLRGNGPQNTYIYLTPPSTGCYGYSSVGICMGGASTYAQSSTVLPGSGNNDCSWTSGYSQGSTTITLGSCGNGPPLVGNSIVLDQPDPNPDTGGVWNCSTYNLTVKCSQKSASSPANADGRIIGGVQYSQQQFTMVTSVTGTGPYTVTISPGVYFNNIISGARAWWAPTNVTHEGIEQLTLDHSTDTTSTIGQLFIWCNQCWYQYNRSLYGLTNHVDAITSVQPVYQHNYFYGSQHGGSSSYAVQMEEVSGGLTQNNILQNTTSPDIKDAVTGSVVAYNFTPYINFGTYMQGIYGSHNSGSGFNLHEGNASTSILADDVWGTGDVFTAFRNHLVGWQPSYTQQTFPIAINAGVRVYNIIGNVLGEPGYHTQYEAFATSTTTGMYRLTHGGSLAAGPGTINQTIYEVGWTDNSGLGVCTTWPVCDPLSWTTLMRWKNYDTVDAAVISDTTEGTPSAVYAVNSNPTPSSTLPASFYLPSKPVWFGSLNYPSYGPDVSSGTTGICIGGSFAGVAATSSGQCTGGTFTASAWSGHANANPAQNCYLNVMNGPPDGSGAVLVYNPSACGF